MTPARSGLPAHVLGLTRVQMGMAFLAGVFVYMACTFFFPPADAPLWADLTWKDMLTVLSIAAAWLGMAGYNRRHPDEEIRLNLNAGPGPSGPPGRGSDSEMK